MTNDQNIVEQIYEAYREKLGAARTPEWAVLDDEHRAAWVAAADALYRRVESATISYGNALAERVTKYTPHPAEVNQHLALAFAEVGRLIDSAERRGDQAGADAWLVARNAIEIAEKVMAEARRKQDWSKGRH